MALHGSGSLAHNLDRFSNSKFDHEIIRITAAQYGLDSATVEWYLDLFGDQPVIVENRVRAEASPQRFITVTVREEMPAYLAHLRRDNVRDDIHLKILQ